MNSTIHFIETQSRRQRLDLCRWVERCYEQGSRVQVLTDSTITARHLDQLLWTFSDLSFVPHRIVSPEATTPPVEPVVITSAQQSLTGFDALVCDRLPDFHLLGSFRRVFHFVVMDEPEQRQASRLLYQQARDAGFTLRHCRQGTEPG